MTLSTLNSGWATISFPLTWGLIHKYNMWERGKLKCAFRFHLQLEIEVDTLTGAISLSIFGSVCHKYLIPVIHNGKKWMLNISTVAIPSRVQSHTDFILSKRKVYVIDENWKFISIKSISDKECLVLLVCFCLFVFFLAKSHHLVKMNNLQFFWLSYFGFNSFKFGQLEDIWICVVWNFTNKWVFVLIFIL